MAGAKGRSGGARPNSGGSRPGAGRPPKTDEEKCTLVTSGKQTPLEFLLSVMNDNTAEDRLRLEAAKTAAPYVHTKKGEGGKKEEQQDAAKKAANKFAALPPPLKLVGGK